MNETPSDGEIIPPLPEGGKGGMATRGVLNTAAARSRLQVAFSRQLLAHGRSESNTV
jgi:hypothetical protein